MLCIVSEFLGSEKGVLSWSEHCVGPVFANFLSILVQILKRGAIRRLEYALNRVKMFLQAHLNSCLESKC